MMMIVIELMRGLVFVKQVYEVERVVVVLGEISEINFFMINFNQ
jgi:hypothetical protein